MALLLAVLAALCWGLWGSTFKLAGPTWRYELYYFDFAFGTLLAATLACLTFGSMGLELTFWDNLTLTASKRMLMWALLAGAVFNLGNMLLMASVSISGIATGFSIGIGTAMLVNAGIALAMGAEGSTALRAAGLAALLVAIALVAVSHRAHASAASGGSTAQEAAATAASALRQRRLGPEAKADKDAEGTPFKGIALAISAGLLLGAVPTMVGLTRHPEIGVGPYTLVFLMSMGIFGSTLVYNLYFLNLPVKGAPLPFFRYLQGSFKQHVMGILGGMMWLAGAACADVALTVPRNVAPPSALLAAPMGAGATLAALAGFILWKEFAGATGALKAMAVLGILLLGAGAALLAMAPGS